MNASLHLTGQQWGRDIFLSCCQAFKIINHLDCLRCDDYFTFNHCSTRSHRLTLVCARSKINSCRYFFLLCGMSFQLILSTTHLTVKTILELLELTFVCTLEIYFCISLRYLCTSFQAWLLVMYSVCVTLSSLLIVSDAVFLVYTIVHSVCVLYMYHEGTLQLAKVLLCNPCFLGRYNYLDSIFITLVQKINVIN